jgi:FMN phosphatase YigB (HAD superfamily)
LSTRRLRIRCVLVDFGNVIGFFDHRKACRHLAALSSEPNELHYDWFSRLFADTLSLFDAQVLSYRVGSRKPDRPFFEACLAAAACPAPSCVYVDDRADFVAAGRELGLQALVDSPAVDVEAAMCY